MARGLNINIIRGFPTFAFSQRVIASTNSVLQAERGNEINTSPVHRIKTKNYCDCLICLPVLFNLSEILFARA